jgi:hypothetical protein
MPQPQGVWELLHAGDWACAHADEEALARVVAALAPQIAEDLRASARLVSSWCSRDMSEATVRWSTLADELRARSEARSMIA